jgi:hypothetical protein
MCRTVRCEGKGMHRVAAAPAQLPDAFITPMVNNKSAQGACCKDDLICGSPMADGLQFSDAPRVCKRAG